MFNAKCSMRSRHHILHFSLSILHFAFSFKATLGVAAGRQVLCSHAERGNKGVAQKEARFPHWTGTGLCYCVLVTAPVDPAEVKVGGSQKQVVVA
jgi:hypothetical protein